MNFEEIRWGQLVTITLAWIAYALLHSLLASLVVKRFVARHRPQWMSVYRLFFNVSAMLLLIPPLVLTYMQRGPWLWQWVGGGWWVANSLAALAALGFFYSLRWYDGAEFLGLRQWRGDVRSVEDQERFHLSPLHRFVRHPWYSLGLVLIWTRDMDAPLLVTAVVISLYFVIGSRFEEVKLLEYHGDVYRRYRHLVPSLVPLPWRYLKPEHARSLAMSTAPEKEVGGKNA